MLLTKIKNSPKILYWAFGIVALAHLFIFIQYSSPLEMSIFTSMGEKLKGILPTILLVTLFPIVHNKTDKILSAFTINTISLLFITLCLVYQIAGVSGQAWSTVAFSGLLILLLFNNLITRYKISQTVAIVFSFMVVWLGWVVFEGLFQTGLQFYHPAAFGYNNDNYYRTILTMGQWAIPALLYIFFLTTKGNKTLPTIKLVNYKYFLALIGVCIIATSIWYYNDMLIPIPVGSNGVAYLLEIQYWSREHLEFSISRLSQISIMMAFAVLLLKTRKEGGK